MRWGNINRGLTGFRRTVTVPARQAKKLETARRGRYRLGTRGMGMSCQEERIAMQARETVPGRITSLDIARALALLAMAIYHFAYDLELFGLIAPGTVGGGFWRSFAILTAASFLLVSGISLRIAHRDRIYWRPFGRRLAILALAAGAVSAATYVAMPDRFVHFGILHCIAVSSLAGLAFLRLPAAASLVLAGLVLWLPTVIRSELFNAPWLLWTGLATEFPPSIDFEPFFPWFAPFLAGIALARLGERRLDAARAGAPRSALARGLAWAGRNSLLIYLLHQPVLLALTWALARLTAPGMTG